MNFFNRFSLLQKLILSCSLILVASFFVAYEIYVLGNKEDNRGEVAVELIRESTNAEIAMLKMSEAMRGFILEPSNRGEFEAKKAADKDYSRAVGEMLKLGASSPEIVALGKEMAKLDEDKLDPAENTFMEKVEARDPKAFSFYKAEYFPVRKEQTANFEKLKELVHAESNDLVAAVKHEKEAAARNSIILLFGAIFFGVGILLWATGSALGKVKWMTEELSQTGEHVTSTSASVEVGSRNLAASAQQAASSLEESSSSLEELSGMVESNTKNAEDSLQLAKGVVDSTSDASKSIQELVQSMDEILKSNARIEALVKLIEEIGEKTEVIDEIVFQTRMLSFNASVEAERAGEHGRGFAVVAQEVGNLAQMSGKSALEIATIVKNSVKEAQSIVGENKEKVQRGATLCHETSGQVSEVTKSAKTIYESAQHILRASQEQSTGIKQISSAVESLNKLTQENAGASEESASAAETLSQEAVNLKALVERLKRVVLGEGNTYPDPRGYAPTPVVPRSQHARPSNVVELPKRSTPVASHPPGGTALKGTGTDGMSEWEKL